MVTRRAAVRLTSLALLVFLPSLVVAKAESKQICKRGLQIEVLKATLPRASVFANPRGAARPVQHSLPAPIQHSFVNEFYGSDLARELPAAKESTPISALPRSLKWSE